MANPKGKYIWTAKVGEKGQIVIPKEARDVFNIKPGDTLLLLGDEAQGIAIVKNDDYMRFAQAIFDAQKREEDDEK
ncbi:AbrB/MazE/SpoVT family DNA-binding domain-containing protein [Sporolactobacillus putidus]|uniref:AbrB family transcriptional regulator n=1 Tax=Sporolactobacillus putidus TaxID=492735 RepID=A0A917S3S5_9BACL|nr:AbrB/MazE/SpoVT family DNA-binding domain-containing protein [Sporolactobacillus putidus]GGL52723.1 AbrB family transcriptional regulator [Sporolactobacillus putidus]